MLPHLSRHRPQVARAAPLPPGAPPFCSVPETQARPAAGMRQLPAELLELIALKLPDDGDVLNWSACDRRLHSCLGDVRKAIALGRSLGTARSPVALMQAMDAIECLPRPRRTALWRRALGRLVAVPRRDAARLFEHARASLWATAFDRFGALQPERLPRVFGLLGPGLRGLAGPEQARQSLDMLHRWAPQHRRMPDADDAYRPLDLLFDVDVAVLRQHYPAFLSAISRFSPAQQAQLLYGLPSPDFAWVARGAVLPALDAFLDAGRTLHPDTQAILAGMLHWESYGIAPDIVDEFRARIDLLSSR